MKNEILAKNIKDLRLSLGLTQGELGEKLNVKKQAVLNWERGNNKPKPANLLQLSKMIDVKVLDLLYLENAVFDKKII